MTFLQFSARTLRLEKEISDAHATDAWAPNPIFLNDQKLHKRSQSIVDLLRYRCAALWPVGRSKTLTVSVVIWLVLKCFSKSSTQVQLHHSGCANTSITPLTWLVIALPLPLIPGALTSEASVSVSSVPTHSIAACMQAEQRAGILARWRNCCLCAACSVN